MKNHRLRNHSIVDMDVNAQKIKYFIPDPPQINVFETGFFKIIKNFAKTPFFDFILKPIFHNKDNKKTGGFYYDGNE